MRVMRLVLACVMVTGVIAYAAVAFAQEGYPLKGTFLGDYGPNKTTRTPVFVVFDWDGKALSGVINPGTDNIPLKNATLTPPTPTPPRGAATVNLNPGAGAQQGAQQGGGGGQRGGRGGGGGGGGQGGGGAQAGGAQGGGRQAAPAAPAGPVQPDWLVHFEGEGKDRSGAVVRHVVDGKVENIGLTNRSIVGTWTINSTKNDFRLVRQ